MFVLEKAGRRRGLEAPFTRTCPECRNWNAENNGRKVKLLPKLAAAWWIFILGSGAGFSCVSPMLSLPFADQRPVYRRRCVGHASVHAIAGSRGSRAWGSGGLTRCVEQETKAVSATPPSIAIEALVLGENARCVEQQQQLQKRRRLEARSAQTDSEISAEKTWRGSSMSVIRIL